ncbi:phage terminase [Desulfosporosinus acididurans]|uniref:Phage terminase n=1 Tax=Desulfosporosinus acididurans TaxID=476652 RepID=A0A0J1FKN3_9FIRM|nr:terminase TerL endonuclease subunit [Desulfosporosinus acididurans]KLU64029.1 phage terminase [Desulfosporosinus acididurans]
MGELRDDLIQYSQDVTSGKITACQKHKWACERFLRDLDREGTDEFPFVFSEEKANRFLDWMRLFKHRKGILKGEHIEPHIIQKFVFGNIYGWIHKDTGYRRFNKAYWQVGRKNAKSQSLSCVGSYEEMAFGEGASEVYCTATKRKQARIVYDETVAMLDGCPELKGKYKIAYGQIVHKKTGSIMEALSKEDGKKGDGYNPQCGIIDEYHAHETSEMYDIIDSGMVARPQPLLMIITTAGFDLSNPCYSVEYKLVSHILDPYNPYENENYFVMINELDKEDLEKDDGIKNEAVWEKANPIVCSYPEGIDSIRKRLNLALEAPEKMRDFLTKTLNVWVQMREFGYMDLSKWAKCGQNFDIEILRGEECTIGADLSATLDLTSVAHEFEIEGKYYVLCHSFMPEERLNEKMATDKVPYDFWVKKGWITLTPGEVVDYDFVIEYINTTNEKYGFIPKELCYDKWNANMFGTEMTTQGYTCVDIRQGMQKLGEPTKNFREEVYQGNVIHNNNPVLTWAIGNAITKMAPNETFMLDKSKSKQRIDPIAAVINAHCRAMVNEDSTSVYETRGVR